ncbi:MAG: DNA primase [bacterium]
MLSSPIEEIKSRLDVVEVVGSYLKLQKTGVNHRALCPFHSEKTPSFFVSSARQSWRCFGCGKGGDVISFVQEIEGVEFGDALRMLAQKAGVELKRQSLELLTERRKAYEILELATRFFEKQMVATKSGLAVKGYLVKRGVSEESIKKWRLGYGPNKWQGLSDFMVSKGYQRAELESAGLVVKSDKGDRYYDRFRGRIIFPVFDFNSQVIGFGGRVFETETLKRKKEDAKNNNPEGEWEMGAKYINTPATILYDKSRVLYGLDKARLAIRHNDNCIIVEGYVDAIMVSQAGNENVVAVSGTALTGLQLKMLKRYSDNLLISFDMDLAGNTATRRGIDLAQKAEFNIRVVTMPEDMDPADVASRDAKEWNRLVGEAESIMDFYFDTAFARYDKLTIDGKKKIAKNLLPSIKAVSNKIEQTHWLERLSKDLKVREDDLLSEMAKIKPEGLEAEEVPILILPTPTRRKAIEERLLVLVVKSPKDAVITEEYEEYFSDEGRQIISYLKENHLADVVANKLPEEINDFINKIYILAETEEINAEDLVKEMKICAIELKTLAIKSRMEESAALIKTAETEGDQDKISALLKEFNHYSLDLDNLNKSGKSDKKNNN